MTHARSRSVGMGAFAALLLPSFARAQSAPIDLCGHAVTVTDHTLRGAGPDVALGDDPVTVERVDTSGAATVLVLGARAVVLHCANGAAPRVIASVSRAWRGEDIGLRTRDDAGVATVRGGRAVVVGRRVEAAPICGAGAGWTDTRVVDVATGAVRPERVAPGAWITARAEPLGAVVANGSVGALPLRGVAGLVDGALREALPALVDRRDDTVTPLDAGGWITARPPAHVPVQSVELTLAASPVPARWTLVTEPGPRRFDVTLSPAVLQSLGARGGRVRITLPADAAPTCVTLSADAPARLAAVALRTAGDDDPTSLARALVDRAVAGDADVLATLVTLGDPGLDAIADALPRLPTAPARAAARWLSSRPTARGAAALVTALSRDDLSDAARDALSHVGAPALPMLAEAAAHSDQAVRAIASMRAPLDRRLAALTPTLDADGAPWTAARDALAAMVRNTNDPDAVRAWLAALPPSPVARARALRVCAEALAGESPLRAPVADAAVALWNASSEFAVRYRLAPALAGSPDGVSLLDAASHDADADLRAESLRVLASRPDRTPRLVEALADPVPRVRALAARSLRGASSAQSALQQTAARDAWPAVRGDALRALGPIAGGDAVLLAALDDLRLSVVQAALEALAAHPGDGISARLVAFAEDGRRDPTLRRDAIDAVGARCDRAAAPAVEHLAEGLMDPSLPPWEQEIGHAAVASLARLDLARTRAFLTRMDANDAARTAVERAGRGACPSP